MDVQCRKNYLQMNLNGQRNSSKFNEDFIKDSDENSKNGYSLEADVEYPKYLFDLHSDLPERIEISKCNKLVCNFYDKKNYVVHKRALKQALNYG